MPSRPGSPSSSHFSSSPHTLTEHHAPLLSSSSPDQDRPPHPSLLAGMAPLLPACAMRPCSQSPVFVAPVGPTYGDTRSAGRMYCQRWEGGEAWGRRKGRLALPRLRRATGGRQTVESSWLIGGHISLFSGVLGLSEFGSFIQLNAGSNKISMEHSNTPLCTIDRTELISFSK
jgi:hypothetical protein